MKYILVFKIIITMFSCTVVLIFIFLIFTHTSQDSSDCTNTNEKWSPCGSDCVPTCSNIHLTPPCNRNQSICIPKCECSLGYVRNKMEECISPFNCPNKEIKCPSNQYFSSTANICSIRRCSSLYYTAASSNTCNPISIRGCICKKGYVLDDINNRGCILQRQCPKICCSKNREFKDDGSDCIKTCIHPHDFEYEPTSGTKPGCYCKRGFVEDGYGNCILRADCPLHCDSNEIESLCVHPNQPTCEEPHPYICSSSNCTRGCICKPPFVRDKITRNCVDRFFCTSRCRDPNAIYVQEGTLCPKTCANLNTETLCLNETVEGCQCKPDYVMDEERRKCIRPEFCNCNI